MLPLVLLYIIVPVYLNSIIIINNDPADSMYMYACLDLHKKFILLQLKTVMTHKYS